jgi:hypothetical protein
MRGDEVHGPTIVPSKSKMVAANIIDPKDGTVIYHVITTKYLNIMLVVMGTLFLAGIVVLMLIIYLKSDIDQNKRQLERIQKEGLINVDDNANK